MWMQFELDDQLGISSELNPSFQNAPEELSVADAQFYLLPRRPGSYTQSPLQDSRLLGPRPWKVLATTYERNDS